MDFTGERMMPEYNKGDLIFAEHMARYRFSTSFVQDKVVLDVACGVGYGGPLLVKHGAKKVVGVDIDSETIEYAKKHYFHEQCEFLLGNAEEIPCETDTFDVVVSFETIEHVENYRKFLAEVRRVMKPNGLFLVSTPNNEIYCPGNPFHLKEFSVDEFEQELGFVFNHVAIRFQDTFSLNSVYDSVSALNASVLNYEGGERGPMYTLGICTHDVKLPELSDFCMLGDWEDKALKEKEQRIRDLDVLLQQKEGILAGLQSDLLGFKECIDGFNVLLEEKEVLIQGFEQSLFEKGQLVQELNESVLKKDEYVELKENELCKLHEGNEDLKIQLSQTLSLLESRKCEIQNLVIDRATLEGRIVELNRLLQSRSDSLLNFQKKLKEVDFELLAVRERSKDREQQLEKLIYKYEAQKERLNNVLNDNDQFLNKFKEYQSRNDELQGVVDSQKAMIVDLEALVSEFNCVKRSLTYKFLVFHRTLTGFFVRPIGCLFEHARLGFGVLRREGVLAFLKKGWLYLWGERIFSDYQATSILVSSNEKLNEEVVGGQFGDYSLGSFVDETIQREDEGVRAIAFYLPQYHAIPENDKWWGKGFTEWTNVRKAQPNFEGHYQPHVPADLGYYDLRDPEVRVKQANLAREYGIYGFCYYYYWFSGKRLLYEPLDDMIKSNSPDFPFCICWANENWTRRWDGADHKVLIAQEYSEDNDEAFIDSVIPLFRDSRYIRVNGKPLLIVYRVNLLPNPRRTAEVWRKKCKRAGLGDIYLCAAQSFSTDDPRDYGFDAAVEFPPLNFGVHSFSDVQVVVDTDFQGNFYDYNHIVEASLNRLRPDYNLFRTVIPSWDNTARRQKFSHVFLNSDPDVFEYWLSDIIGKTCDWFEKDERLVFINAWNEWGEGCCLEPNSKYGHAYLQAVQNALIGSLSSISLIKYLQFQLASKNRFPSRMIFEILQQFRFRDQTIRSITQKIM